MKKVKGILIDLGNTIIYNRKFEFIDGLKKVYDLSNKEKPFNYYLDSANQLSQSTYNLRNTNNNEIKLANYLEQLGINSYISTNYNYLALEYEFLKASSYDEKIEEAEEFLKYITSESIPIVIVSNSTFSSETLKKQLDGFGLNKYFKGLISSANVGKRKPSHEIFDEGYNILKTLNSEIKKEEIIFIGNDYFIDIMGAFNAGLRPFWFNENNIKIDNINNYSEFTFSSYYQLITILNNINRVE